MSTSTVERWKENLGIEINLTEEGLHELALMIADGCPRRMGHHKCGKMIRIECLANHIIDRKTCFKCWYKWLEEHSTIKEML